MLNFIVYEDEKEFSSKIISLIKKIMRDSDKQYEIKEFSAYDREMKKIICNSNPKIYIMDIEIPNSLSGIDISRIIRETDWNSIIILVTSHVDLSYEALKAQIMLLDFISKYNECLPSLEKTIKKALSNINYKKVLVFEFNRVTYRIYTDDIFYIYKDSVDRKSIIVTEYGNFSINKTISVVYDMLDDRFYISHRSCIINTSKIFRIDWTKNIIYFNNKLHIDYLSRDKKKGLKEIVENN